MKRTYLFGTIMAFSLAAASVGAQQDRPTPSASDQADKSVVVTGCLKSGTSSASATTGTAGATGTSGAASAASFILADAKVASGSSSASATGTAGTGATAGTAGTSGSPASSVDKDKDKSKSFALVGGTQSELQGYVNSKVEITGTIDPSDSASPRAGSATGSTASPTGSTMPGMSHAGDHAKLKVTSVRQVAGSCDPGQQ